MKSVPGIDFHLADGEHFAKIEMPATYKFKNGMGVPLC